MQNDVERILMTEEEIKEANSKIGAQITKDYQGKELLVVGILKGSSIFMSDLIRNINLPLQIDYMVVSSYGSATESSGVVRIVKDLQHSIENKHILIVEDIVDTGLTLAYIKEILQGREPASIKICTLLDKPARRKKDVKIDYVGAEVPDGFIIGYGIDYAEYYRNLPYVAILKPSVYEK
ncbi:MAG TPA: hypoxanthine phosphoribosyltransferase [Epulopiscium sp.]|nr:hypoxanthine phosphoribosyltransferase [Candidatus Epulonipiscium sp.]